MSDANNNSVPIRENLIATAVKFLINPNVLRSPIDHKHSFLKKKGLTDEEIRVAFERAESQATLTQNNLPESIPQPTVVGLGPPNYVFPPQTRWSQFREIMNGLAIIGGLAYGLYLLYKRYVEPWLFARRKKPKTLEQSVSELNAAVAISVTKLNEGLAEVKASLGKLAEAKQGNTEPATARQINELRVEIVSVKGLLLGRNQFPSPVIPTPAAPSIPTWQMAGDKEDETSGASNGSDSSLEMIRDHSDTTSMGPAPEPEEATPPPQAPY